MKKKLLLVILFSVSISFHIKAQDFPQKFEKDSIDYIQRWI